MRFRDRSDPGPDDMDPRTFAWGALAGIVVFVLLLVLAVLAGCRTPDPAEQAVTRERTTQADSAAAATRHAASGDSLHAAQLQTIDAAIARLDRMARDAARESAEIRAAGDRAAARVVYVPVPPEASPGSPEAETTAYTTPGPEWWALCAAHRTAHGRGATCR